MFLRKHKHKRVITFIILLIIMWQVLSVSVYGNNDNYAWVLKEVIDYDRKEEVSEYNENNKDYELMVGYSPLAFYQIRKYIGKDDDYYDPPKVNGESVTINANWSTPPNVIEEGEEVTLQLSLSAGENTLSYFSFDGGTRATFDKAEIKPGSGTGSRIKFMNKDGKYDFVINKKNNYKSISETVSAVPKKGSEEGEQIALLISFKTPAGAIGTKYIYEWTNKDSTGSNKTGTAVEETNDANEKKKSQATVIKLPEKYKDSGVRFSDLWGDVQIRHGDDRLAWDFGGLDMVICEGDHIRTGPDSGCIISLPDLTTFHMKPNSELIIVTSSEQENKLKLLAGKIIANVKKMIEDGSMDVEMSEAVAGIKGTTFVIEENGVDSILKVLEGKVELSSNSGDKILVTNSQKVRVKNGVLQKVEKFSASKELEEWDDKTQLMINKVLKEKGITLDSSRRNTSVIILTAVGIFLIVILVIFIRNRKRKFI
ncbi:MAG: hypothetical protein PWQ70_2797 [Clostridiales bacterium]|jgi:hypothetical protein|nr:hypothetical protein [Clostridiales bacterium]